MTDNDPVVEAAAEAVEREMLQRTYDRHAYDDEVFAEGVADIAAAAVAAARPIIEAEVRRSLLWECPDCAFGFDRIHTDEDGGYSCPVCELAEVRERIAGDIEAAAPDEPDRFAFYDEPQRHISTRRGAMLDAARIARGEQ